VKLAYLDLPGEGAPAVVLHREASPAGHAAGVVRSTGVFGRTVAPIGDYAYYPSGMAIGGICWYRLLPGYSGTDPISLAKAVVQVCDLLDDLALDGPLLAGFGQGAVVALGAGLLRPDRVGSVAAVDPHPDHLALLPAAVWGVGDPPSVLLAASGPDGASALDRSLGAVGDHGVDAATWCWEGDGGEETADPALAEAVRVWWADGRGG
jgi:pimeloyl-ACP methyl ester carboxylesterase